MSITDELREWKVNIHPRLSPEDVLRLRCELNNIADRIDAEYQKAIRELNSLADASVLLPVDADGVPIRVGDKVYQVEGGWVYTVKSITFYPDNTTVSFECKHGFGCDNAHSLRHYHEPTVEDVLREFTHAILNQKACYREQNIAEYAAKLRLTNDGKEQ